jgi:hypothetical protein
MTNDYVYLVCGTDTHCIEDLEANGYKLTNCSTDGTLTVVDKKDHEECQMTHTVTKPSYVVEEFPNFPYLTQAEAKQLISYQASAEGASDGWTYSKTVTEEVSL